MPATKRILTALPVVALLLLACACGRTILDPPEPKPADTVRRDSGTVNVRLQLHHVWGDEPAVIGNDTAPYRNAHGEAVLLTRVKYYLSNAVLIDSAGVRDTLRGWYHIVNMANPASLSVDLPKAPAGRYRDLELMIGVDSLRNVSGAQAGALAPDSGLFWDWNTGYVHTMVEGYTGRGLADLFAWHVGGYARPTAHQRRVRVSLGSTPLPLASGDRLQVALRVDLATVFAGSLRIADSPILPPGSLSTIVANQWGRAVSSDSVWVD